jgi:hypothetical protein
MDAAAPIALPFVLGAALLCSGCTARERLPQSPPAPSYASDIELLARTESEPEALEAIARLHAAGIAAFPELRAHLNDDRRAPALMENRQVGVPIGTPGPIDWHRYISVICFQIIASQLDLPNRKYDACFAAFDETTAADWLARYPNASLARLRELAAAETLTKMKLHLEKYPDQAWLREEIARRTREAAKSEHLGSGPS